MHVPGDGQRQLSAGASQCGMQWLSVQHPAEQVDVIADQAVVITVNGADVSGGADLDLGGRY